MITSVKEDFQVRRGSIKGAISDKGVKLSGGFSRRFLVTTDDPNTDQSVIVSAAYAGQLGLPAFFSPYPSPNLGKFAYVIGIDAQPRQSEPKVWDVVYDYTTDLPPPSEWPSGSISINTKPTKYGLSYTTITRACQMDQQTNVPITNSAGEPFNPPLEREIYLAVVTVNRAEPQLLLPFAVTSGFGRVNSNTFYLAGYSIIPFVALRRFRQSEVIENGLVYFDTTYEFIINPDGWAVPPLDQGNKRKNTDQNDPSNYGKLVTITDQFGVPDNRPHNLDGNGNVLPPGSPPVFLDGTKGKLGPYNVYSATHFTDY